MNHRHEAKETMVIGISSGGPSSGYVLHDQVKNALLSAHGNMSVSVNSLLGVLETVKISAADAIIPSLSTEVALFQCRCE